MFVIGSHGYRHLSSTVIFLLLAAGVTTASWACGRTTDCRIGERGYRIVVPDDHNGAKPIAAVVYVHGYRGTAAAVMGNAELTAVASKFGVAFVAAQAAGPEWNIPNIPSADALSGVDELAYFDALSEDLVSRFDVDPKRILVAGFSSGAMTVWHLACYRGDSYGAFVSMSGTFWEPLPATCPTIPTRLFHYHGTDDPVVPLQGRRIKDAHQGDVQKAVALMASLSDFRSQPLEKDGALECLRKTDAQRRILEMCLFRGNHQMKIEHLERAIRISGLAGSDRFDSN